MKKLFLCTCNKTLDKKLDFTKLERETASLFDEVKVHDALCLKEGLKVLADNVGSEDRVVIGACSSQIIEIPIARQIRNDYVTIVPIREQVAWVHHEDKEGATNKAAVLLTDGATWIDYLKTQTEVASEVIGHALVIGGGLAGLQAASDLLRLGIQVTIAEPVDWNDAKYLEASRFMADSKKLSDTLKGILKSSKKAKRIKCDIIGIAGQVGDFNVSLKCENGKEEQVSCGAIIVATEPEQYIPPIAKLCKYGTSDSTILLSDLPSATSTSSEKKILVAIDPRRGLSRVGGTHLLRTVRQVADAGNTVIVIHEDIRTDDENLYRAARDAGVIFLRGTIEKVKESKDGLLCIVQNVLESTKRNIPVDILAIHTNIVPRKGTESLAETLGVEVDNHGFIKTRYSKMKPVQTSKRGIFIAGNAKMPMGLSETLSSAQNAALEAFKILRSPVKRRGWIPVIDEEQCDVCKACTEACPNDALRIVDEKVEHIPVHCEFCGICVSVCPTRAIEFQSHGKESWFTRLETIAKTHERLNGKTPFNLVYACSECANASIDQAGFAEKTYPSNTYVLQFPCAGMVSPIEILKGLVEGAENVIVAHCPPGGCHHQNGDHLSELVVQITRDMLREIGQNPDRVRATYMIAALPNKMQEEVGSLE